MGPPRPAKPPSKERLKAYHKTALVWSLWNNPRTILKSCYANTQGWVSMEQLKIEFHQRCQDRSLKEAADRVVSWFKNKVRAQARRRAS